MWVLKILEVVVSESTGFDLGSPTYWLLRFRYSAQTPVSVSVSCRKVSYIEELLQDQIG